MALDVVPQLNQIIGSAFKGYVMKDRQIAKISKRIRDGTADLADAHDYAQRLGEDLSRALIGSLTPETLPNGTLYYNIAQRTIIPGLENNYQLINKAAGDIQKSIDQKNGIGLGVVTADFPIQRINGLIDKMTSGELLYDYAVKWLAEPIVNNSEAFADDFVEANCNFRHDVGLKATITRIAAPGCCEWCSKMEGTYEYGSEPADIYRRHENCRCIVTFKSQKTSQNVWTKRTWTTSQQELERRKSANNPTGISVDERLEQMRQLERDRQISDFQDRTGLDRSQSARVTRNKSPDQIEAEIRKIKERRKNSKRR